LRDSRRRRTCRCAAALLALAALACASCGGSDGPRSAVLITLDTTRADALGCFGGKSGITPALDALASESVLFESAFSVAPLTLPAHASMLTGLYPLRHTLRDNGLRPLPSSARTLAEAAREAGFQTGAFVAAVVLAEAFGLDQGFEHYDAPRNPPGAAPDTNLSRPAREVVDGALGWLAKRDRERPFFLWVHLYDPHAPYTPPQDFQQRAPSEPYLGEVASMDHEISRVIEALRADGTLEGCAVLIAADHGEGLLEHEELTHGAFCYQTTMHVPMLMHFPGGRRGGERSKRIASLVDVHPTLAAAMGIAPARDIDGIDLASEEDAGRGVYFESYYGYFGYDWGQLAGWVDARFKYIHSSAPELYDLTKDPRETTNLAQQHAQELAHYQGAISALATRPALQGGGERKVDEAMLAQIQALGYAALGGADEQVPHPLDSAGRVAPAERADELRLVQAAQDAMTAKRYAEAEQILREVVAANPRNYRALNHLGLALAYQDRRAEAIEPFTRLIEIGPPRAEFCVNLGLCLASTGRVPDALAMYRRALELDPDHVTALDNLVRLLEAIGRAEESKPFAERLRALRGGAGE
jgi:arylsulfatase A-like enzyme